MNTIPAGKDYPDFDTFLKDKREEQPFVYWFGSSDPHRTYETNTGIKAGMDPRHGKSTWISTRFAVRSQRYLGLLLRGGTF